MSYFYFQTTYCSVMLNAWPMGTFSSETYKGWIICAWYVYEYVFFYFRMILLTRKRLHYMNRLSDFMVDVSVYWIEIGKQSRLVWLYWKLSKFCNWLWVCVSSSFYHHYYRGFLCLYCDKNRMGNDLSEYRSHPIWGGESAYRSDPMWAFK